MHTKILSELGLAKNEAIIYETLLMEGKSSVGKISIKSKIHRRNIYDSLNRLKEKGLVFEILQSKENLYQAVDPHKLTAILNEKRIALDKILPTLDSYYKGKPQQYEICVYQGIEGMKNYLSDIIKVNDDVYTIGGGGIWADERIKDFIDQFRKDINKTKIKFHLLYDHEVKKENREIIKFLGSDYKFLPPQYSTSASIDIFGDHVVIMLKGRSGNIEEDSSYIVIINQQIAEAYKVWFKLMNDLLP